MTTTPIANIGVHCAEIPAQCVTLTEVALSGSEGMKMMGDMIVMTNHGKKYMEVKNDR